MREIKFRAWDKKERVMCDVEVMSLSGKRGCFLLGNSPTPDFFVDDELTVKGDDRGHFVKFKDLELMQYTGLIDKNGKRIYEGDVVQFKSDEVVENFEVRWDEDWAGFRIDASYLATWNLDLIEVVGNIYENPDLLL